MGLNDLDEAARVFTQVRPRLFGIVYRMLGSAAEAEDVVQDVWVRWQTYDRETVDNPGAFLATTATRLAINQLRSARVRREAYVGPWLPEPVDTGADPYLGAETGDLLETAVLVLLEKLTPNERAALVLREAFDYSYGEIASILRSNEPAVRQMVSRARKRVTGERRAPVPVDAHRELLATFITAARTGDVARLEKLLAAGVSTITDGNGARYAARKVVTGVAKVAPFLAAFPDKWWVGVEPRFVTVNGGPGAALMRGDELAGFLTMEVSADGIEQLFWILSAEKLAGYLVSRDPEIDGFPEPR
ncbi:sigma-70 family RNA polymerase sigma factor [Actinoplanes bogorensis]|uniref:Sigma-70 family RNA polymerase sigma factor n=1 Tax=Paractinoplanes bogorensis TaxID=1610840 RepID=A0ABS5YN49_9ACTN|nr:sigma-70 family RNA polymerase sigma factor [Actinoplanes bogorensis]MBU2664793.1 sigma-70 family RNA polymerase sigma factor [Actinoplanes bogorensis]